MDIVFNLAIGFFLGVFAGLSIASALNAVEMRYIPKYVVVEMVDKETIHLEDNRKISKVYFDSIQVGDTIKLY